MRMTLLAAAILLSIGTAARADVLAGGPIFGGPTQAFSTCYVLNTGPSPVGISSAFILDQNGNVLPPLFTNCGSTLGSKQSCGFDVSVASNTSVSCEVVTTTSDRSLRGSIDIRNSIGGVLSNNPFR